MPNGYTPYDKPYYSFSSRKIIEKLGNLTDKDKIELCRILRQDPSGLPKNLKVNKVSMSIKIDGKPYSPVTTQLMCDRVAKA